MGGTDVNIYTADQTAATVPAAQIWRFYGIDLGGGSWAWAFVSDAWGVVTGHDGEVLTAQADGSLLLEALPAGVAVSDDPPGALGAAAAGVSDEASRSDHVHPMPSAADVGADPARLWSRLASDVTIQSDDSFGPSGLSVAVEASKVYRLHAQLLVGGSSTADAKFSVTLPAGATLSATAVFSSTAAGGSTQYTALAGAPGILSITEGATIAVGAPGADTRHWPCIVDGIVTTGGTAGDCVVEWAQNTSTAANTVLHAQSWLELVEVS
jgi:hypothetical protein